MAKIVIERSLVRIESGKVMQKTRSAALVCPQFAVTHERIPVHEKRPNMWKQEPETTDDCKAMRIEIAPIVQRLIRKPMDGSE